MKENIFYLRKNLNNTGQWFIFLSAIAAGLILGTVLAGYTTL